MGMEDVVQMEEIGYYDWSIAATVLTVNKQRGFGALARTGVGTLTITFPNGKGTAPVDANLIYMAVGTVLLTCTYDKAASTSLVHQLRIFDNAGAAIDNVPGKAVFQAVAQ